MAVYSMDCFNCGLNVAGNIVFAVPEILDTRLIANNAKISTYWLQCPNCGAGSVKVQGGGVFPIAPLTSRIDELPDDVQQAWLETGLAYAVGAYTSSEMICRKILMHVAVDKANSAAGKTFAEYVNDLETNGLIVPGLKNVVDLIRQRGNTANHELPASTSAEALQTIQITNHLLQTVYVLPALAP